MQSDDEVSVQRAVAQFIPRPRGPEVRAADSWIRVADPVFDRDREAHGRFAKELSDRLGAVTIALGLEGEVVRFRLFERGRMVDEYLSVPTQYGALSKGDELALAANPTLVSRLTGASTRRGAPHRAHRANAAGLPPAPELYEQIARLHGARAVRLIDAARCPYCARVRIALAEKGIEHEAVAVDLNDRPRWVLDLNPPAGRVPVIDDGFVLPESVVIMEYLEERHPEPALLPAELAERALARLSVQRFGDVLHDYYALRRGEDNTLAEKIAALEVGQSLYADIAYVPWVIRARDLLGLELPERIEAWLAELARRPSVAQRKLRDA